MTPPDAQPLSHTCRATLTGLSQPEVMGLLFLPLGPWLGFSCGAGTPQGGFRTEIFLTAMFEWVTSPLGVSSLNRASSGILSYKTSVQPGFRGLSMMALCFSWNFDVAVGGRKHSICLLHLFDWEPKSMFKF